MNISSETGRMQPLPEVARPIIVLTYDHPHRKTEDVIWRLMAAGHWGRLRVVGTPWVVRKERHYLYGHRPAEKHWPCEPTAPPDELCAKLGLSYQLVGKKELADILVEMSPALIVIGGAGILPKAVVDGFTVLNFHPGLLPARRGLDVLKWAVHDAKVVGVTAHVCDEHTDLGWRVADTSVPVYREDSFHSFAMRQYEAELSLMSEAVELCLNNPTRDRFDRIRADETEAYRRMPVKIEAGLMDDFERYKRVFS